MEGSPKDFYPPIVLPVDSYPLPSPAPRISTHQKITRGILPLESFHVLWSTAGNFPASKIPWKFSKENIQKSFR